MARSKLERPPKVTAVALHEDSVIKRHQLSKWANWYSGAGHEYPEFDIYGPFLAESEGTRGDDPLKWEEIHGRLKELMKLQESGRDVAGSTLRKDFGRPDSSSMFDLKMCRTVCDDQGRSIFGGDVILADLNSGEAFTSQEGLASQDRTLARVQTYRDMDDAYQRAMAEQDGKFRPRPFYKDYRHYSKFGFAGKGAKTAWASNPKLTKADYDPERDLYTKPPSASATRYDELYVTTAARCDARTPLTKVQKKLLQEFADHSVLAGGNESRKDSRSSWSAPVTLLDHSTGTYK
jgi:hypothetical protein